MRSLLIVTALGLGVLHAESAPTGPDFRKTNWGMNREQVVAAEQRPPDEIREDHGAAILRYDSVRLGEMTAKLYYVFANNKLARAKYIFDADHEDPREFIADFRAIDPLLKTQHGKPTDERAVWENAAFQDEPKVYLDHDRSSPAEIFPSDQYVGEELAEGHLRLLVQWANGRTEILHLLSGENRRVIHQVEYSSSSR